LILIGRACRERRDRWAFDDMNIALAVFSLYVFLRVIYMFLFSTLDMQEVYLAFKYPYVVLSLLIVVGKFASSPHVRRVIAAGLVVGAIGFQGYGLYKYVLSVHVSQSENQQFRFAREVNQIVDKDEIVYGATNGMLGFLADRKWINGDGVVNNLGYARTVLMGPAPGDSLRFYLERENVDFVCVSNPNLFKGRVVYDQILDDRQGVHMYLIDRRAAD
jgi:hypothetical protein